MAERRLLAGMAVAATLACGPPASRFSELESQMQSLNETVRRLDSQVAAMVEEQSRKEEYLRVSFSELKVRAGAGLEADDIATAYSGALFRKLSCAESRGTACQWYKVSFSLDGIGFVGYVAAQGVREERLEPDLFNKQARSPLISLNWQRGLVSALQKADSRSVGMVITGASGSRDLISDRLAALLISNDIRVKPIAEFRITDVTTTCHSAAVSTILQVAVEHEVFSARLYGTDGSILFVQTLPLKGVEM
jgi:hypothetical protein